MIDRIDEHTALAFLRDALPFADRISVSEDALMRVTRHALDTREKTPWGKGVPDDIFLPYVLFPRVNNERPAFYHGPIAEQVMPRLAGLDMEDAVLEVNRWCYEQATYQSTDGRTADALTVIRRGFGRCGEESVLLVSALRACGIPARQVYVPLWSHCDDNHAWVEAWVDGSWRYLGACEPELALDSGWFTAAASKAMLVHTRAWGMLPPGERCERREGTAYVINRTAAYAKTALLTLRVTERGAPVSGLRADFEVANMGAFRPICVKRTDEDGVATLLAGLGTLHVWLTDGVRGMGFTADTTQKMEYDVDFGRAAAPAPGEETFVQRPPVESRMQPADFAPARVEAHRQYLEAIERERAARFPITGEPLVDRARGNGDVIAAFLADGRFDAADKRALLESLREKDLADATADVLADALTGALPYRDNYPRDVWVAGVLCPRVADEALVPARRWIRENLPKFDDPQAVWDDLNARLRPCEMEPASIMPDPRRTLACGRCSDAVRDALFVAVCRANGIAAKLDPLTGDRRVWMAGAYRALPSEPAPDARLVLVNAAGRTLAGDADFSVARLEGGAWRALNLGGAALANETRLAVTPGLYRVTATAREIDGGCVGVMRTVAVEGGGEAVVRLSLPETHTADKLLRAPLPPLAVRVDGKPAALPAALSGRPGIVAVIAPGQEPTEHFLNELIDARALLAERGIRVWLLTEDAARADNAKLARALESVKDARLAFSPDPEALREWRARLNARELRLPLAVAIGRGGAGLFAFVNYNVGSVAALIDVVEGE